MVFLAPDLTKLKIYELFSIGRDKQRRRERKEQTDNEKTGRERNKCVLDQRVNGTDRYLLLFVLRKERS